MWSIVEEAVGWYAQDYPIPISQGGCAIFIRFGFFRRSLVILACALSLSLCAIRKQRKLHHQAHGMRNEIG
jgi:hypothetical protein